MISIICFSDSDMLANSRTEKKAINTAFLKFESFGLSPGKSNTNVIIIQQIG